MSDSQEDRTPDNTDDIAAIRAEAERLVKEEAASLKPEPKPKVITTSSIVLTTRNDVVGSALGVLQVINQQVAGRVRILTYNLNGNFTDGSFNIVIF